MGAAVEGASVALLTQPADVSTEPGSPLATLYAASSSNSATVTAASWAGQQILFTLNTVPADVIPGSYIAVSGASPAGYNSSNQFPWQVVSINALVVTVTAITNPGTYISGGTVATSALPNPTASDGNGHYFAYLASGIYTLQVYGPTIVTQVYLDQAIGFNNSGSVTSVGLTMPAEFSVSGSPVTMTGTLAVTKANENANLVFAGPSTGAPAAPTFRSLVSADLPSSGGVTSVALSASVPGYMSQSVSGSPVTTTGTLGLTLGFGNEAANVVFAGPSSGGSAPPAFRALVAADVATAFNAIAQFNTATLGADIAAIPANTLQTVLTLSFTVPASGGPFRIMVFYNLGYSGATQLDCNAYVTDGTNLFGGSQSSLGNASNDDGIGASDISPVTYANGASVTLTLKYQASAITSVKKLMANAGPSSYFRAITVPSV